MSIPTAFISYSWDDETHKNWVRNLAVRLRSDGVEVMLDQWHTVPGDQLPVFMERAVRESNFVLIICTPRYKERSDQRTGGVGYEGDIITGEVMTSRNQRKFIPILRLGTWTTAAPSWLSGKYFIDLSGSPYSEAHYQDLLTTLLGQRPQAPPVIPASSKAGTRQEIQKSLKPAQRVTTFEPIKIKGVVVDEVNIPQGDGTRGSALYRVPFRLSRRPPLEWSELFVRSWNLPPSFTSMHRPGIASVFGDTIVLDGTTIEEVEQYHRNTLILAVQEANRQYQEYETARQRREQLEKERLSQHQQNVTDIAKRIKFDE